MNTILYILITISILFFLLLILKTLVSDKLKKNACVVCGAISLTWIVLLILYKLNLFSNNIIIAILLGQSILGIFYFLDSKVYERFKIFRLPFLLTLIILAYSIIVIPEDIIKDIIFLLVLWLIFILIYYYRNNNKFNTLAKKLIECCRNW